jgi:hypothetical protein
MVSGSGAADLLARMTGLLEAAGIPYMLTGSFASTLFGAPRTTQDIDIVIEPTLGTLEKLLHTLSESEYYVSREAAREAYGAEGMFNLVDFATGWKVDLIIRKRRAFSQEEFKRRRPVEMLGMCLVAARAEDVIVAKLEWAKLGESERQLRDVAGILRGQGDALDVSYIEHWVTELQLGTQWAAAKTLAGQ